MKILKKLFRKKQNPEISVPENFLNLTKKAIEIIGNAKPEMDNDELYDFMILKEIPEYEAGELITFLPISFCKLMLPNLNWPKYYYDYFSENKKYKKLYSENKRYLIIENETQKYYDNNISENFIINIAGRSAEFDAINKLLNDGGKLEDILLTETYIVR